MLSDDDATVNGNAGTSNDGSSRRPAYPLYPMLITFFLLFAGISLIAPFLPEHLRNAGLSEAWAPCIFAAYPITMILVAIPVNALLATVGRRQVFRAGIVAQTVGVAAFAASPSLQALGKHGCTMQIALLVMARALQGAAAKAIQVALLSEVTDSYQSDDAGLSQACAMSELAISIGFWFGPLLGGVLFQIGGFPLPFMSAAGALCLCLLLPPPPPPLPEQRSDDNELARPFLRSSADKRACRVEDTSSSPSAATNHNGEKSKKAGDPEQGEGGGGGKGGGEGVLASLVNARRYMREVVAGRSAVQDAAGMTFLTTVYFALIDSGRWSIHAGGPYLQLQPVGIGYVLSVGAAVYAASSVCAAKLLKADRFSRNLLAIMYFGALWNAAFLFLLGPGAGLAARTVAGWTQVGRQGEALITVVQARVAVEAGALWGSLPGSCLVIIPALPAMQQSVTTRVGRPDPRQTEAVVALFEMTQDFGNVVGPILGAFSALGKSENRQYSLVMLGLACCIAANVCHAATRSKCGITAAVDS